MGVPIDPAFGGDTALCLDGVTAERITWLWPGYLPAGKLVVIDGDPSVGKSTFTLDLAARCSAGAPWPDRFPSDGPGAVLLMSAEDGVADTIVPRLDAARADRSRVYALTQVPVTDDEGNTTMSPPQLPRDIGFIEQTIRRHQIRLLVVDVLMAYLSGKVDSHRDQDVRTVLHHLAAMADRTGCCIILIRHLNKAGGSNPLYRGGGSIGIVGAARAAFIVGRDPDDQDRRIFAVSKMNIAAEPPTLAYRLVSADEYGCARVEWEDGPVDVTARDLVSSPVGSDDQEDRDSVKSWLVEYLQDEGGSAAYSDILKAGQRAGYSKDQLKRAKNATVKSARPGGIGPWLWELERNTSSDAKEARAHLESKGAGSESALPSSLAAPLPPTDKTSSQPIQVREIPRCPTCRKKLTDPEAIARGDCGHPICQSNRTSA